jgi:hypothetical protein
VARFDSAIHFKERSGRAVNGMDPAPDLRDAAVAEPERKW